MLSINLVRLSVTVIILCNAYGVWSDCKLEVLSDSETSAIQVAPGSRIAKTCLFRSTCDANVGFYRSSDHSSETVSLTGPYWLGKGIFYQHSCTLHKDGKWNKYACKMTIDAYNYQYASHYYCTIVDKSDDRNRKQRYRFFLTSSRSLTPPPIPTKGCFLPEAQNISVSSVIYHNGSVGVTLKWAASIKETNNNYCTGSRRWRVLVQSFSNVADTPVDGSVIVYGNKWDIVPSRDTQFNFSQLLNNITYYQFLIGHRPERVKNASRIFGSNIYYFGKQNAPVIKQPQQQRSVVLGLSETLLLQCIATGTPSPNVWWISDSRQQIIQDFGKSSSTLLLKNVTVNQKGTYFCIASNVLVTPPNGKTINHRVRQITVDVKGYNNSSSGIICSTNLLSPEFYCKDYLHSQFSIYSNLSISKDSSEGKVGAAMTKINQYITNRRCRVFAKSLLCHTVYPYCDVHQSIVPLPRPICNAACMDFKNGKCNLHSDNLKKHDPQLYEYLISKCQNTSGGQAPECIPITYDSSKSHETQSVIDTGSCVRGNGIGYSGNQIYTKSRHLCQLWTLQSPHKHPMLPAIYASELQNAGYSCRNPGGLGTKPWCYTTNTSVRWEYCDIPQCDTCDTYNGSMCSNIAGYDDAKVYVRRGKLISNWMDIENEISQVFLKARYHHRPSIGCQQLLRVLICHVTIPLCADNKPRRLCGDHCKVLKSLESFCPGVFEDYMSFVTKHRNSTFLSGQDCHTSCMYADTLDVKILSHETAPANSTSSCYNDDDGRLYGGNVSVTQTGVACLNWNQSHSSFIVDTVHYKEVVNASNYCRNPGGLLGQPWCLTNTMKGWDYCALNYCIPRSNPLNPNAVSNNNGKDSIDGGESSAFVVLSVMFSVVFAIFVIGIVSVGVVIALIRKRRQNMKSKNSPEKAHVLKEDKFVVNSNYLQSNTINNASVIPANFRMLETKQIKYVSQLGQGNFGIVFKGKAFNISSGEEETDVAVKSLKEESSSEIVSNFIDEAKLMFTFNHPNILQIYGVCMSEMPYQMVLEYMDGGDLTQFLRARASSTQRRIVNPFSYRSRTESSYSNDPPSLNKTQLLFICSQISDGMKYLASVNHVHRDLACRNCLVKSDLTVKIGDFGMSRNLYSRDYYRVKGQAILPVRWMPPEALVYGTFSVEGDVWSFGVVMWEVFSFALQPYYGRTNEEVTEAIRHGKILNRPDDCPTETYELMKECWNMEPKSRPTFDELFSELSHLHHCSEIDYKSESDNFSYDSDDSDAFLSEENNSLPEGLVLT